MWPPGSKITRKIRKAPAPRGHPHRKPNQATLWSRKFDAVRKRAILPWQFRTGDFVSKVHFEVQTISACLLHGAETTSTSLPGRWLLTERVFSSLAQTCLQGAGQILRP